jgi:uncharacterized protein (TIGR03437 family)
LCICARAQSTSFEETSDAEAPFRSRQSGFTAIFRAGAVEFQFPHARPMVLRFHGSRTGSLPEAHGLLPGHTTYFLGRATSVSRWYEQVTYKGLYPGIDVIFHHANGELEYDFVVAPGADPSQIDLAWESPQTLITQRTPVAYQQSGRTRHFVAASDHLDSNFHIRFLLGRYDPALPLVIDPVLVYTNYVGGDRTDTANAVAVDSQGNVYLAGTTNSYNFSRTQNGPAQPPSGNLLTSSDNGKSFAHAPINNTVLAMASTPAALFAATTAGPYRSTDGGSTWQPSNAGIANFATNSLLTDTRFPARVYAATDQGLFRSDDSGLTWNPTGTGLPAKAPIYVIASSPLNPAHVFVLASDGFYRSQDSGQTWAPTGLPISPVGPAPTNIAIDPMNPNVLYIAGAYSNTNQQAFILKSTDGGATFGQISTQAVLTSLQSMAIDPVDSSSIFAAGIDGSVYHSPDGGNTWTATSLTNLTLDAVVFDPNHSSNLYALADQGLFLSTDHGATWSPTAASVPKRDLRTIFFTASTLFLGQDSGEHAFLTKWNPAGNRMEWSIILGGSYFDDAAAIAVDASGNPYIAGTTGSTDFPVTPGAFQPGLKGFQNIFLTKLNPSGTQLIYSTLLGGSESDALSAIAIDSAGSTYLAGYAVSPDFPTTAGSYQPRHAGTCNGEAGGDAFVSKFNSGASSLIYSTLIGGSCAQLATAISLDSTGHAYITGATVSPDFPATKGVLQPTYGGSMDGFLSELTPAGDALVFSTYLGGQNSDIAAGVAVDSSGNIFIAGNGIGFPFVAAPPISPSECNGVLVTYAGLPLSIASPPYLLEVSPGATSLESLHNFADCGTIVQGFAVDTSGKAWLGGIADPTSYDTVAPFQTLAAGSNFVRQYASDAKTVLFSSLLDSFQNIALDSAGSAYIAAEGDAPGIVKQLLNGSTQPSAAVSKIDASVPNAVAIDTVQKTGTLSIPALADYSGPLGVAPGELIALSGHGLGPATPAGAHVTNGFLDTTLSNVEVRFNGILAPLSSVQANRIVCVAPFGLSPGRAQIQVTNNGIASNPVIVTVTATAVGVLQLLNQDGTVNSASNPAAAGSTMVVYATGLGATSPPSVDGAVGGVLPETFLSPVSVVFDDPAPLTYIGSAPGLVSGITQINFVVPAIEGQSILSVIAGASTDYVYVYVQ